MKLSIITVNKDNAAGLRKTMESVFAQTYRDFEYIIIDGASTDSSVEVIREYESSNSLNSNPLIFKWISEPDKGIFNAMNKGIMKATGEYLLFLNSGDFLVAQDVIEKVFAACNGANILCAKCNISRNGERECTIGLPLQITFGWIYCHGLPHQSTFIKRLLFEKYGLYREDFKYNSDVEFWCRTIIEHRVSTQTLDIITTDYNLEGISSKESQTDQYIREKEQIFSPYDKFTPDYAPVVYNDFDDVLYWVKRHKSLYKPLKWMYKFAVQVKKRAKK